MIDHEERLKARIERAALEKWAELDLSSWALTHFPYELLQLRGLWSLNLADNCITEIPASIGNLGNLWVLNLTGNQLTEIPAELGELSRLRSLILSRNDLTELPQSLGQLIELKELALRFNRFSTLPRVITRLRNLKILDLFGVGLQEISSDLGQLQKLEYLDLRHNQLSTLPSGVKKLDNLKTLRLRNNPLPIPVEILGQIKKPSTIVEYYFDYLTEQTRPLNEIKLVLVGQGSVGKTSLVNRLLHDAYDPDEGKTEGIDIQSWELESDGSQVRVNVWDFGGQEIMHATHQFFLTHRTLYVLVLDTRQSEEENRLDYWLSIIHSFGGDSPVLVVGNKIDQHPLDLDKRGLLAEHQTVQTVLETSCKTGEGIPALRQAIEEQLGEIPHVNDPLINTWFEIKSELEIMDVDYIPFHHYVTICRKHGVEKTESQRILLQFLHDLGVVLHFLDPRLETTNILNPEWVTQGVYRILNTRLPFDEPGVLTWEMLARILDDEPYQEKRMFIVDMMQKFELCYEIPDRHHTYLIPDLLPKEARDTGAWADALRFEVHYPVLPGSILTRLIVRMHRLIEEQTVWRTGVLLTCEGNEALVRADLTANRIQIQVRGPEYGRRDLLTRIREHLDAIHASLTGLQAEEKVPVPEHPEVEPVDYKWLRELERRGRKEITPPGLYDPIRISKLLNGVEPPEARQERESGTVYHIDARGSQIGGIGDQHQVKDGINFNRAPEKS